MAFCRTSPPPFFEFWLLLLFLVYNEIRWVICCVNKLIHLSASKQLQATSSQQLQFEIWKLALIFSLWIEIENVLLSKKIFREIIVVPQHLVCLRFCRSAELDDILEEESDDENSSPSPPVISSPSSNSPDGSFRLRNVNRRPPPNAESSSSASSTDGRVGTPPSRGKVTKTNVTSTNNHIHQNTKNQDSGFSDSAASDQNDLLQRATRSESLKPEATSSEEDQPQCEVIHETRASTTTKQYHVSKVYFYSVRDVLTEDESAAEKEHVSILDCETGRVRKGYAQPGPNSPGM